MRAMDPVGVSADTPRSRCQRVLPVAVLVFTKFVAATGRRSLAPFAIDLGEALGCTPELFLLWVSMMNVVGAVAPLVLPLLLRRCSHAHVLCLSALSCACAHGALTGALLGRSATAAGLCMLVVGGSKSVLDATVNGVCGPLARASLGRPETIAAWIETSWGLTSLIGFPAFGLLLSWRRAAPFVALAALHVLAAGSVFLVPAFWRLPRATAKQAVTAAPAAPAAPAAQAAPAKGACGSLRGWSLRRALPTARVRATVACVATLMVPGEAVPIVFSVYLKRRAGWSLPELSRATFLLGVADLLAELVTAVAIGGAGCPAPRCGGRRRRLGGGGSCAFRFTRRCLYLGLAAYSAYLAFALLHPPAHGPDGSGAPPPSLWVGLAVGGLALMLLAFETSLVGLMACLAASRSGESGAAEGVFFAAENAAKVLANNAVLPLSQATADGLVAPAGLWAGCMLASAVCARLWLWPPPRE